MSYHGALASKATPLLHQCSTPHFAEYQEEVPVHAVPHVAALRKLLIAAVLAATATVFTPTAEASTCTTNLQGVVSSSGVTQGEPDACAPEVGRPAGTGTGRKVG
jgi:hypothetical protein